MERRIEHGGFVIDFKDLKSIVQEAVIEKYDHQYLNELISHPTAENLCLNIWETLKPLLPGLHSIRLYETEDSWIDYNGGL